MALRTPKPKKKQNALLTVVRKGFADVGKRLDRHDRRFDAIDQRFSGVEKRLDRHDQRFDAMDRRFDGVEKHFVAVDRRLSTVEHNAQVFAAATSERFTRIEATLETLVKSVDHFIKIYSDLAQELTVLRQHVRDMEARVQTLEQKLKAV